MRVPLLFCSLALAALAADRIVVVGHRGFPALAPENTLPSFAAAATAQADIVELDFRTTADGTLVVLHDSTPTRTTDAVRVLAPEPRAVEETPLADLRRLDAGAWFDPHFRGTPVPTLAEALAHILAQGRVPLIERKSGTPAQCLAVLVAGGWRGRVVVQSFDWNFLRELHALAPDVELAALGPLRSGSPAERLLRGEDIAAIAATGARTVVWSRDLDDAGISAAHARGLKVFVYTLNDAAAILAAVGLGVDGLITDNPALAWRVLASGRSAPIP